MGKNHQPQQLFFGFQAPISTEEVLKETQSAILKMLGFQIQQFDPLVSDFFKAPSVVSENCSGVEENFLRVKGQFPFICRFPTPVKQHNSNGKWYPLKLYFLLKMGAIFPLLSWLKPEGLC